MLNGKNDPEQKGEVLFTEKADSVDFILVVDFQIGEGCVDFGICLYDSKEQIQVGGVWRFEA